MTSRAANRLTALFTVLTLAAAVFGIWRYQSLSATVKEQRQEISRNNEKLKNLNHRIDVARREIEKSHSEIEMSRGTLASVQSASNYARDGGYEIIAVGTRFKGICDLNIQHDNLIAFCDTAKPSIEFVLSLTKALQARIAAPQSGSYDKMREDYRAILRLLEGPPENGEKRSWRAIAEEGIAYADMKRGHVDEAQDRIGRVIKWNPNDAGAGVTALKIMCVQHFPENEVKERFSSLVSRLGNPNRTKRENAGAPNVRRKGELFLTDAELYQLCGYANLDRPI